MEIKLNCWDIKKCGCQPGGKKVSELGVCPAAIDTNYEGMNNGKNGGRICWAISGTFCDGKIQGTFAEKIWDCMSCEVIQTVKKEEGSEFQTFKKYNYETEVYS